MFSCEEASGFVGTSKSDKDWGIRMDCGDVMETMKLWELGDGVELRIGSNAEFLDSGIFWGIGDCWRIYIWGDGVFRELIDDIGGIGMLSELDGDSKGDDTDIGDRGFWTVRALDKMQDNAACALLTGYCWLAECKFV